LSQSYGSGAGVGVVVGGGVVGVGGPGVGGVGGGVVGRVQLATQVVFVVKAPPALGVHV
jgi:hypothetical protein